ncbi:MAG: hypothetical protein IKP40_09965 [Clostridia bacterium]|nr:hypothetical protein [Clostridia bacterium]
MRFIDLNDGRVSTPASLKKEWELLRAEEPWNHAPGFRIELLEILLATVSGRNDLSIVGPTPRETVRYIQRLQAQLLKSTGHGPERNTP